ncbi:hypothetical protein MXB_39 [Myxobolus squamalis]|nr:hypothetical protein MXB_39 [Myxobolus squamalis]
MIPLGLTKNIQLLDISVKKLFKIPLQKFWEKWIVDVFKTIMKSASIKHASY